MPAKMLIAMKKKPAVGDFHTYQNTELLRTINNVGKCCLSFPHSTPPISFNFQLQQSCYSSLELLQSRDI